MESACCTNWNYLTIPITVSSGMIRNFQTAAESALRSNPCVAVLVRGSERLFFSGDRFFMLGGKIALELLIHV
jgi:hypothetical protein